MRSSVENLSRSLSPPLFFAFQVEVCAAADETFFDQVILVLLDLPSGYIFVEEITENCQYETWQQRVSNSLKPLGLKVKYLVSDRAKAIVKLALKDLGTHSIADLFHVLYDLNRSIAWELNYLASQLQKQLILLQEKRAEPELIAQIETNQTILEQSRLTYEYCCHGISSCLHPFDSNQNTPQTTEAVTSRRLLATTSSGYQKSRSSKGLSSSLPQSFSLSRTTSSYSQLELVN